MTIQPCGEGFYRPSSSPSCTVHSICSAGKYEAVTPTSSTDRVCIQCPAGKFQPYEGQLSCNDATVCPESSWATREVAPSSDRICTDVTTCKDGQFLSSGLPCECSLRGCATCRSQSSFDGVLLVREDAELRAVSIFIDGEECISISSLSSEGELIYACRDLCLNYSDCTAFSIVYSDLNVGKCCLKKE